MKQKYYLALNAQERRLMIESLNQLRNELIADGKYTDADLASAKDKYPYCTPFTKESLLYRDIFEEYFPGKADWIKDFWMPNRSWDSLKGVNDPSARVLSNYGASGK